MLCINVGIEGTVWSVSGARRATATLQVDFKKCSRSPVFLCSFDVIPERGTTSPSPKTLQAVTIIIVDDAVVAIVGIKGGTEFS